MSDHGTYTAPRTCAECDFQTTSRDEYWKHRLTHEEGHKRLDAATVAMLHQITGGDFRV